MFEQLLLVLIIAQWDDGVIEVRLEMLCFKNRVQSENLVNNQVKQTHQSEALPHSNPNNRVCSETIK